VQRIGDQIAEIITLHGGTRSEAQRRAVDLLDMVGVPQPATRARQFPHQFSGGMCQRAMIAMAMANRPQLLIADEPTTAVDVSVQAQLFDLLRTAKQDTGAAVLLITHDMGVVAENADRVCVMYAGRVVESGPVDDVFTQPAHPYTRALLNCVPRLDRDVDGALAAIPGGPPDPMAERRGCAFAPRCPQRQGRELCGSEIPVLLGMPTSPGKPQRTAACHFSTEPPVSMEPDEGAAPSRAGEVPPDDEPLLEVTQLVKRFAIRKGVLSRTVGEVHAVDDISFTIRRGETLGLVGESGCGKSTTSRLLLRLVEPTSGDIRIGSVEVATAGRRSLTAVRQRVQMVFQDPLASLNPRWSVGENAAEPLRLRGDVSRSERMARVHELFERVGLLPAHSGRLPHEFSGGQRQRVAIARALITDPELVLLDEPVSALDVSVQAQVLNLLADLKRERQLSYLFVSHDLSVVRHISDRVAVMYLGKIVEIGPKRTMFTAPRHPYTRALLASVPVPETGRARTGAPLQGEVPSPTDPPTGCRFRTRCPRAEDVCAEVEPPLNDVGGTAVACHFPVLEPWDQTIAGADRTGDTTMPSDANVMTTGGPRHAH